MPREDDGLEATSTTRRYLTGDASLDEAILNLVTRAAPGTEAYLVSEIISTALKLARDQATRGDMKILSRSLRELRYAFKTFRPYRHVRKVSVFGSARVPSDHPAHQLAHDFGEQIVREGFMVITGAGDGIMGAAQRGAGSKNSFGVNILLPFEQLPNEAIRNDRKLMTFKYFFSRKLVFLKESDAVVLFPGGFGTHDEGFESLTLLQTGKANPAPIVYVHARDDDYWRDWDRYVREHLLGKGYISPEDVSLYRMVDTAEAAVAEIRNFYRVYHSARYVGDQLVLRLQTALPTDVVAALGREFHDILKGGTLDQRGPLAEEVTEPELNHLPRLVLHFNRRNFGRLRQLIDRVNESVPGFEPAHVAQRYTNGSNGSHPATPEPS
ncbi:MAG: TIGR00730 family Rossman fold protein [Planctomycetota bacterium]